MHKNKKPVYNKCLDLLAKQDYSQSKLINKLLQNNYSINEISEAINKLKSLKLINEEEYAKRRVKTLIKKNYGKIYILEILEQEQTQVTEKLITQCFYELDITSKGQILSLIEKKAKNIQIEADTHRKLKIKQKIFRYIVSKGHSQELTHQLIDEFAK